MQKKIVENTYKFCNIFQKGKNIIFMINVTIYSLICFNFHWKFISVREGFKKIMENSLQRGGTAKVIFHILFFFAPNGLKIIFRRLSFFHVWGLLKPPPPRNGKNKVIFSETRHHWKSQKTTFRQAKFCLLRCQILPRHAQ